MSSRGLSPSSFAAFAIAIALLGCKDEPKRTEAAAVASAVPSALAAAPGTGAPDLVLGLVPSSTPRPLVFEDASAPPMPRPAASQVAAAGTLVTFGRANPTQGRESLLMRASAMKTKAKVGDRTSGRGSIMETEGGELESKQQIILAASGKAVTKMKVTYNVKETHQRDPSGDHPEVSGLVGRSMFIEWKGGKAVVTSADGKPLSDADAAIVAGEEPWIGKPDPFLQALPTTPLKVGEAVPMLASFLKTGRWLRVQFGDMLDVQAATVTLRDVRDDEGTKVGVFDLTVKLVGAQGPASLSTQMTGTMSVQTADGLPSEIVLEGPMQVSAARPVAPENLEIEGTGMMTLSVHWTYK